MFLAFLLVCVSAFVCLCVYVCVCLYMHICVVCVHMRLWHVCTCGGEGRMCVYYAFAQVVDTDMPSSIPLAFYF